MILPDCINQLHLRGCGLCCPVDGGADVLAEHVVPLLRRTVHFDGVRLRAGTLILEAECIERLEVALIELEERGGPDLDRGAVGGVDRRGREAITHLVAVGVLHRPVVGDEVPWAAGYVLNDLVVLVVRERLTRENDLVDLGVGRRMAVPVLPVTSDERAARRTGRGIDRPTRYDTDQSQQPQKK